MNQSPIHCAIQFDDADQQRAAAILGMWIFLTTEVLFFGGMFVAYTVYRFEYPDVFLAASQHVNLWAGGAMTAILLTGSLLVAMSDHALEHKGAESPLEEIKRVIIRRLVVTAGLGVAFLGLEFTEYYSLIRDGLFPGTGFEISAFSGLAFGGRSAQLFFVLFFCMTGLHAVHMLIGISLVLGLAITLNRSPNPIRFRNPLKVIGLYWHFVDIVWIFLYPLFYLVR